MLTIWALDDDTQNNMEELGALAPLDGVKAKCICFQKKVVTQLGAFIKSLRSPLYSTKSAREYAATHPQWVFDEQHCLGAVCTGKKVKATPKGYVVRQSSIYRLALPVYNPNGFSPLAYTLAGYLATSNGYLMVLKRRVAFWVWLAVAALAVFGISYACFAHGITGAFSYVDLWWGNAVSWIQGML